MDLQPNKIDGIIKPITNKRISASEWNQLVGSCMEFIYEAGYTPDPNDNTQFLNAFKTIALQIGALGANINLDNLSATGEAHFANPSLSNITNNGKQEIVTNSMPDYANGITVSPVNAGTWTQVEKDSFVIVRANDPFMSDNYLYVSPDNGTTKYTVGWWYNDINSNVKGSSWSFFVPKGWYFTSEVENPYTAYIYPLKGAQ